MESQINKQFEREGSSDGDNYVEEEDLQSDEESCDDDSYESSFVVSDSEESTSSGWSSSDDSAVVSDSPGSTLNATQGVATVDDCKNAVTGVSREHVVTENTRENENTSDSANTQAQNIEKENN